MANNGHGHHGLKKFIRGVKWQIMDMDIMELQI